MAEQRYINRSERAKHLAEGVHLWAILQNTTPTSKEGKDSEANWDVWAEKWGEQMAKDAKRFQGQIFDLTAAY